MVSREVEGFPQGSALGAFLLRVWAIWRELYFSRNLDLYRVHYRPDRVLVLYRIGSSYIWLLEMRNTISMIVNPPPFAPHI